MKAWVLVPVAAVALAVGLFAAPSVRTATSSVATVRVHAPLVVRVAVVETRDVMSDACVFSAEAMAAGAPAQCGSPKVVAAVMHTAERPAGKALVWPGDFIEITATAAVGAWDATLCFVDSLFGYATEKSGLDI